MSKPSADDRKEGGQDMLASKTVIGAVWLLAWRFISRGIGMISTLILARVLVPSDFGIVAMATTFSTMLDTLSQIGVQDALVRRADNNRDLFDTAFTLQVGRGILTLIILSASGPVASWWFGEPRLVPLMMALGGIAFISSLENVGIVEFRRGMRYSMVFSLLTIPRVLSVLFAISAALILKSYWALLIGMASSVTIRTVTTYIAHPFRPRFSLAGWRHLAGFSFWIWAACIVGILWDRIDVFVLGPIFGSALLGLYVIALELASLPMTEIVSPVSDALFAGFSRARTSTSSSAHHAPVVAVMLVMVIAPITITISCASGYVVAALLGPHWSAAAPLISILAWLCLFSPLSNVCNTVLVANGHVMRGFVGKAIATAVKLAVLLIAASMTKRLDAVAAAVTGCVALESCAYLLLMSDLPDVRLRTMMAPISRAIAAGLLTVLVLHQLGWAWQSVTMPSPQAMFYGAAIGLSAASLYAVFVALLWLAAGRPAGPETRFLELAGNFIRPLMLRFSR
jgi:O-antigen/teichoic acid export membrane protein